MSWKRQTGFGHRVSMHLDRRGWSVRDLAVRTEASLGYLYRVVRGEQEPTWSLACAIADALGINLDALADDGLVLFCPKCGDTVQLRLNDSQLPSV